MNTITKLRNNVHKNYIFTFLRSFDLTQGIWMLYLAFRGLSLLEIGIMESIYHITSFTMEIPTGMIADLYGRKTSRFLGRLCHVIGTLAMLLGANVWIFGLSFALSAIGNNLESGAGEALVYDSLKEIGEEKKYMKIKGREEIFFQIASAVALLLGGYLGTINYSYVYILASVFGAITCLQTLTFVEPTIGKVVRNGSSLFSLFISQFTASIRVIKGDLRIVFIILAVEVSSTFLTTLFYYTQNYMKANGRNELQIGLILAIGGFVAAITALYTHRIEKVIGFRGLFTLLPIGLALCFWGVTFKGFTEIALILMLGVDSILAVVASDYINRLIPSEQRATILSFQSMAFSLFMIMLFPLIGRLGDIYGLLHAFRIIATVASIILLAIVIFINCNPKVHVNESDHS